MYCVARQNKCLGFGMYKSFSVDEWYIIMNSSKRGGWMFVGF